MEARSCWTRTLYLHPAEKPEEVLRRFRTLKAGEAALS